MKDYITHWEFYGELAMLVIRENMTSSFAKCKTLYFSTEQYQFLTNIRDK